LTTYPSACSDYQVGVGDVLTCGTWTGITSNITTTKNVTADWFKGKLNSSDIQNPIWVNKTGDTITGSLIVTNNINTTGNINATGSLSGATLNTGQGSYELYKMDQDVDTLSSPTFGSPVVTTLNLGTSIVYSGSPKFTIVGAWIGAGSTTCNAVCDALDQGYVVLAAFDGSPQAAISGATACTYCGCVCLVSHYG